MAALQHWKVDDMGKCYRHLIGWNLAENMFAGHQWASTEPNFSQLAAGTSPAHIQASSIVMAFFDQFVKPT